MYRLGYLNAKNVRLPRPVVCYPKLVYPQSLCGYPNTFQAKMSFPPSLTYDYRCNHRREHQCDHQCDHQCEHQCERYARNV